MRYPVLLLGLLLASGLLSSQSTFKENTPVNVKRITPVLYAQEVEPCVKFWVERLGFVKTAEVPDGDRLGFAILQKGSTEIMYQSFASAEKDIPALAKEIREKRTFLYVEVGSIDEVLAATKGAVIVVSLRTTSYGAKEVGVRDPAGNMILFAEFGAQK